MNLDELISKYLDGELTEQEDDFLWKSMTSDLNSKECETARYKFDSAVSLQLAMKEDAASIFPSDKLVAETEDMILMRIFSNAPKPANRQRRRAFIWSSFPLMAALVAFFMFVFVFEVSDINYKSNNPLKNSNRLNLSERLFSSSDNLTISKFKGGVHNLKTTGFDGGKMLSTTSYIDNTLQSNQFLESNISENIEEKIFGTTEIDLGNALKDINGSIIKNFRDAITTVEIVPQTTPDYILNEKNIYNLTSLSDNSIYMNNNALAIIDNAKYLSLQSLLILDNQSNSEVEVSSIYGSDFLNGDLSVEKINISHFSQSIAYAINLDERFGVEFGLSSYSYVDKGVVNIEHKLGGISGVESYEGGYDFSIGYPQEIRINTDKQLFWGTIFYENSFFRVSDFAFTGRIGLGGSSEGAMGYGRLYAEYLLFDGLKLTVGTEARMFDANFSNFGKDENLFKYSAALLYGIEFKF